MDTFSFLIFHVVIIEINSKVQSILPIYQNVLFGDSFLTAHSTFLWCLQIFNVSIFRSKWQKRTVIPKSIPYWMEFIKNTLGANLYLVFIKWSFTPESPFQMISRSFFFRFPFIDTMEFLFCLKLKKDKWKYRQLSSYSDPDNLCRFFCWLFCYDAFFSVRFCWAMNWWVMEWYLFNERESVCVIGMKYV